jgi:hypothetical protein
LGAIVALEAPQQQNNNKKLTPQSTSNSFMSNINV